MAPCRISVIIPNRNGAGTIGLCLEALFTTGHDSFEVIVVDDASTDDSVAVISRFPCTLVRSRQHRGAAAARNLGARASRGDLLLFIDADCLVQGNTLARAERASFRHGPESIIGGTYTLLPHDRNFFSRFQSVFIHWSELRHCRHPDYVAGHAMVIPAAVFFASGGFREEIRPMIEDVEYSHRLRRQGYRLVMDPGLQVRHVFNLHSLADSLKNGFRKSRYWTIYSLANHDLLTDSGTASRGLKFNTLVLFLLLTLAATTLFASHLLLLALAPVLIALNLLVNRGFFILLLKSGGTGFLARGFLYYTTTYPLAVGAGGLAGLADFLAGAARSRGAQQ